MIDYKQLTKAYARKYGIPEALAVAQIGAESGFNPRAVSSAGAQGLAQFMPATARGVGLRDPFNPHQALDAYGKYFSGLLKTYKGNTKLALAAYNAGGGAVSRYGGVPPYAETQGYVKKILAQAGGAAVPAARTAKKGTRNAQQVVAGAPNPQGVHQPTLAASDETFGLINKWLAAEDKAFASGQKSDGKLWNQVLKALQQSPVPAPQVSAGGVTVAGTPGVPSVPGVGRPVKGGAQPVVAAGPAQVNKKGIVPILPGAGTWGSYGYADPEGQGGKHLGVDWHAKAGTPFRAPTGGRIVRITPDPTPGQRASGQVFGGTLALRDGQGRLWVFRHSVPGNFKVGQKVAAGAVLGTVKDWGSGSHIHLETYAKGSSDREYGTKYALNPGDFFK